MWTLGTPGLDFVSGRIWTDKDKARLVAQSSEPVAEVTFALLALNQSVRKPLVAMFAPLQLPFRLGQDWNLYRDGPNKVRRLEIRVDDAVVYRSVDPNFTWLEPQLRNRRVRPMVESTTVDRNSPNWKGLSHFIVARAREDFPTATRVELRCLAGSFPGQKLTVHHSYVAEAPDWTVVQR